MGGLATFEWSKAGADDSPESPAPLPEVRSTPEGPIVTTDPELLEESDLPLAEDDTAPEDCDVSGQNEEDGDYSDEEDEFCSESGGSGGYDQEDDFETDSGETSVEASPAKQEEEPPRDADTDDDDEFEED